MRLRKAASGVARGAALEARAAVVGQRDLVGTALREELLDLEGTQAAAERLRERGRAEGGAAAQLAELAVALELTLVVPLVRRRLLREVLVLQLVLPHVAAVGRQHHRLDPHQAPDRLLPRRVLPAEAAQMPGVVADAPADHVNAGGGAV